MFGFISTVIYFFEYSIISHLERKKQILKKLLLLTIWLWYNSIYQLKKMGLIQIWFYILFIVVCVKYKTHNLHYVSFWKQTVAIDIFTLIQSVDNLLDLMRRSVCQKTIDKFIVIYAIHFIESLELGKLRRPSNIET